MRALLGIVSFLLLAVIIGVTAWGVWFASPWEGSTRQSVSFSWQTIVAMLPLTYLAYCLLCAIFCFPRRFLLISGIVAHLGVLVVLVAVIVYSIRFPQDSSSGFIGVLLVTSAVLASLWLARFRSVSQQQLGHST